MHSSVSNDPWHPKWATAPGCDLIIELAPDGSLMPAVYERASDFERSSVIAWTVDRELLRRARSSAAQDFQRLLARLHEASPCSISVRPGQTTPAVGVLSMEVQMLLSRIDSTTGVMRLARLEEEHLVFHSCDALDASDGDGRPPTSE